MYACMHEPSLLIDESCAFIRRTIRIVAVATVVAIVVRLGNETIQNEADDNCNQNANRQHKRSLLERGNFGFRELFGYGILRLAQLR